MRRALVPVLSLVIGLGGVSFGLAGATLPFSPASSESELPEETTVPEEPESEEPADAEEPEVVEPAPEEPPAEEPLAEEPVAEESDDAATDTAVQKWSTEGCPEGFTGNHGRYVSSTDERPRKEAAHSQCGKPVHGDDEESAQTGKSKKGRKGAD